MWSRSASGWLVLVACLAGSAAATAQEGELPTTEGRPDHRESARERGDPPGSYPESPALPEGMSLDEVLERASQPPPDHFPDPVPDDELRAFLLFEQLEGNGRYYGSDGRRSPLDRYRAPGTPAYAGD